MTNLIHNNMNIKNFANKSFDFTVKRTVELIAIFLILSSFFLFISLASYSPNDPNFIFPENTIIKNFMGSKGSFIADIFYQSLGLVSLLFPFTIFFTGLNIFKSKRMLLVIENIFFAVLYLSLGSLFFTKFYTGSFWLAINGNGGFVGIFLNDSFLSSLLNPKSQIPR